MEGFWGVFLDTVFPVVVVGSSSVFSISKMNIIFSTKHKQKKEGFDDHRTNLSRSILCHRFLSQRRDNQREK